METRITNLSIVTADVKQYLMAGFGLFVIVVMSAQWVIGKVF